MDAGRRGLGVRLGNHGRRRKLSTRRRRRGDVALLLAAGLAVVALAACTGSESGGAIRPISNERGPESERLVAEYVELVLDGEVESANARRCTENRIAEDSIDAATVDARQLQDDAGPLRSTAAQSFDAGSVETAVVGYGVSGPDTKSGQALRASVALEDDKLCIASFWNEASEEVASDLLDAPADRDASGPATLPEPINTPPEGFESPVTDDWASDHSGVAEGWTVAWQRNEAQFGGARLSVERFGKISDASFAADELASRDVDQSTSRIDVGAPGAFGYRMLGYGYLGVQPPDVGPWIDQVVVQRGEIVAVAAVTGADPSAGHSEVLELVALLESTL